MTPESQELISTPAPQTALKPVPVRRRCYYFTATGRRCRSAVPTPHATYCARHATGRTARAHDFSEVLGDAGGFFTNPRAIHRSLAMLYHALAANDISARRAAVLTYIASQMLRTLPMLAASNDANDDSEACEFIVPPRGCVGEDFPTDSAPAHPGDQSSTHRLVSSPAAADIATSGAISAAQPAMRPEKIISETDAASIATTGTTGAALTAQCAHRNSDSSSSAITAVRQNPQHVSNSALRAATYDGAAVAPSAMRPEKIISETDAASIATTDAAGIALTAQAAHENSDIRAVSPLASSSHPQVSRNATFGVVDTAPLAQCAQKKSGSVLTRRDSNAASSATSGATSAAQSAPNKSLSLTPNLDALREANALVEPPRRALQPKPHSRLLGSRLGHPGPTQSFSR
jgi:hypothetical protein